MFLLWFVFNGHLPIINFNEHDIQRKNAYTSIGIFHQLKISFSGKVNNILLKTINAFPIGYREIVFLKRERMLPGSVSYHHVSQPCCKPVIMNYLTKVFLTKYKLEHKWYGKAYAINYLARNQGNEVTIVAQIPQCLLSFN